MDTTKYFGYHKKISIHFYKIISQSGIEFFSVLLSKCSLSTQVRYLKSEFQDREFPALAEELYQRNQIFRDYNNSLDRTVCAYNRLKLQTKEVEYNLIAHELKEIDQQLEKAEGDLNWNSEGKNF